MVMVPSNNAAAKGGSWFDAVPLLVIPLIVYNFLAFGGKMLSSVEGVQARLVAPAMQIPMPSDAVWAVSWGDLFIVLSLILLFVEIIRSTGIGKGAIINHGVSMIVFIACVVQFLLFDVFATSAFFLLTLMTLLDVVAGFVISIVTARRDFAVGGG